MEVLEASLPPEVLCVRPDQILGSMFQEKLHTFHSKLFSNSKEGVEIVLGDIDLPVVHEVEHALHVPVGDAFQVED